MALRDQPYLPLFVQDFLTDEKLMECSASATGIYIRLMCIMHKSDEYGVILLKQKDKQKSSSIQNFALKLARFMPYQIDEITAGLTELLEAGVIQNGGDKLFQKRMVRDNEISNIRSKAGKKGGLKTQKFAKAKVEANTEYEYIYNNKDLLIEDKSTERRRFKKPTIEEIEAYCQERQNGIDARAFFDHYEARGWIPKGYTTQMKDWKAAIRTWEGHKKSFNNSTTDGINRTDHQRRGEKTDQYWHS